EVYDATYSMLKSWLKMPRHSASEATTSARQLAYAPRLIASASSGRSCHLAKNASPALQSPTRNAAHSAKLPSSVMVCSDLLSGVFPHCLVARPALGDHVGGLEHSV